MLAVVAPALLPGGLLVYAVCTFDRRECEDVVAAFLRAHPRFAIEDAAAAGGRVPWARLTDAAGAVRTWPHRDGADGFFAVRLRLASS
jgi:16S rRNA (cytosine967-C5)-methyltransferase